MSKADIEFTAAEVKVTHNGYNSVLLEIEDANTDEVLESVGQQEALDHFGSDAFLEMIGRDAAISYFNIEEAE